MTREHHALTGKKLIKTTKIHTKTAHCGAKSLGKFKNLPKNHHASADALFFRGSLGEAGAQFC